MKIEIDTSEKICVYAVSVFGWGRGDTVGEALDNMFKFARGCISPENIVNNLNRQHIALYLSNEVDGIRIEGYVPRPSKGKWMIHLGDDYNAVKAFVGKGEE